jgi:hypothetical protein
MDAQLPDGHAHNCSGGVRPDPVSVKLSWTRKNWKTSQGSPMSVITKRTRGRFAPFLVSHNEQLARYVKHRTSRPKSKKERRNTNKLAKRLVSKTKFYGCEKKKTPTKKKYKFRCP